MIERELEVVNRLGLHARAAAKFVHLAGSFESRITVSSNGQSVDGKSILGILLLAAAQGVILKITCEGPDENEALAAIEKLIRDRFGEDS
ncbi:MAG: HPr family phosphocarrier protein [Thermoanaerobaculia bacterium]